MSAPTTTNFYPELWELRAYAAFNTVYVVGVNRTPEVFQGKEISYLGKSLVADLMGRIVKEMGEWKEFEVVDIDLDFIRQRRIKAPFLKDRKPQSCNDISYIYIENVEE